jgi:hypothetical protein
VDLDGRLATIASRQYGLITRRQALAAGVSSTGIKRRVATGVWEAIRPGVYRHRAVGPTWAQAVLAACLAGGDETFASHLTAAGVWALESPAGLTLETVSPPGRRIRLEGVRSHRSKILPSDDLRHHRRIPVTSPARTIVEISGQLGPTLAGRITDDAVRRRLLRIDDLRACVARLAGPGRRRLSVVRTVLVARLPGYDPGDSDLEVTALRALVDAGLPLPRQQHRVRLPNGRRAEIDLAYPEWMIAIELDGWNVHSTRSAFDGDRARANELVALGWHVVRFTSTMSTDDIVRTVRVLIDRYTAPETA